VKVEKRGKSKADRLKQAMGQSMQALLGSISSTCLLAAFYARNCSGWEFTKLLMQIVIFFLTLRCFYKAIIHRKSVIYVFYSSLH